LTNIKQVPLLRISAPGVIFSFLDEKLVAALLLYALDAVGYCNEAGLALIVASYLYLDVLTGNLELCGILKMNVMRVLFPNHSVAFLLSHKIDLPPHQGGR